MSLNEDLETFFPGNKIYGPYVSNQDGRSRMTFRERRDDGKVIKGGKSFSMSLARAKMTVKEGRILEDYEEVDHRDEDNTNDSDDNLQLLNTLVHNQKTAAEAFLSQNEKSTVSCPNCGDHFFCERSRKQAAESKGRKPCCSRHCSSALYARNQNMEKTVSGL